MDLLKCTVCGLEKPIDQFENDKRNTKRYGKATRCLDCHRKTNRIYSARYRAKKPTITWLTPPELWEVTDVRTK